MKKIYSMLMIAASLTMLWGCSSSDDDDTKITDQGGSSPTHSVKVGEAPNWTFDTNTIPPGAVPSFTRRRGTIPRKSVGLTATRPGATRLVTSQRAAPAIGRSRPVPEFSPYRMAAIVDGEVREVCTPTLYNIPDVEESLYCFMLYIPFGSEDDSVEIQYYNAKANQTYVAKDAFSVKDYTIGDDELFLYTLRPMSAYYLVVPPNQPFTPSPDDELAMFMGDECCGVGSYLTIKDGNHIWSVSAYDMNYRGEKFHVRYYSSQTQTIYMTEPRYEIHPFTDALIDTLKFK